MSALEVQLAEITGRLEEARDLERLRIARETVSEVMAEMWASSTAGSDMETAEPVVTGDDQESSAFAGAERRVVGVLFVLTSFL